MSLETLPTELLSRVCRFLGLLLGDDLDFPTYDNASFKSLRFTCRKLYEKTTYDAAVRYGLQLEGLGIHLNYKRLCHLLHISNIPAFRDKIHKLYLWPQLLTKDTGPEMRALEEESNGTFLTPSDILYMLAECFRNLRHGKRVTMLKPVGPKVLSVVLLALEMVQFPRRIIDITLHPKQFLDTGYGILTNSPSTYAPYIKIVQIIPPKTHFFEESMPTLTKHESHAKGYHTGEHREDQAKMFSFLRHLDMIEVLQLWGCSDWPHLRICNGCNDIFARNIATINYANLTTLCLRIMFISGGRLRRFIKTHASTLYRVSCVQVTLTDGSWRSIAQGLSKIPGLRELGLSKHMFQKTPVASPEILPRGYLIYNGIVPVYYIGIAEIKTFLREFINYFETIPYIPPHMEYPIPQYYTVRLFSIPDVKRATWESEAWSKVEQYAEEVFKE
jgi:hypothetical protein